MPPPAPTRRPAPDTAGPGGPICWPLYDDENTQRLLAELTDWVDWITWRFELDARTIPPCWQQHGPLVEELSALFTAWRTAYTAMGDGAAPLLWMNHFHATRARLTDWTARTGCRSGAHRTR